MFHRQMFEELRRITHLTRDPTESVAIGTVEASFKCCASAIIVLTKTGRWDIFFVRELLAATIFFSAFAIAHTGLSLMPPCPPWHMPSARRPRASFDNAHNLGSYFWPFETWTLTFWKLIISPWSTPSHQRGHTRDTWHRAAQHQLGKILIKISAYHFSSQRS